jgi:hypothetical protein
VPLAQNDNLIQQLSPQRADEWLSVSVLPRRCAKLFGAQVLHAGIEHRPADPVAIAGPFLATTTRDYCDVPDLRESHEPLRARLLRSVSGYF